MSKKSYYGQTLCKPIYGNDCFEIEVYTFPSQMVSIKVSKGIEELMSTDIEYAELVALRDMFNTAIKAYDYDKVEEIQQNQ
jgi:hypothetical protein